MSKLLAAFIANQTDANRTKLQRYLDKHMMAICLASADEIAALKTHGFRI